MDRQADRLANKRNDRQIGRQAKILVCDFYNKMDFLAQYVLYVPVICRKTKKLIKLYTGNVFT